jgi:RimJ/RimL family protein N-acetyltransferase
VTYFKVGLRPYQADDAPLLYDAASESIADIYPWMPWCHPGYTLAESEQWVPICIADREAKRAFDFVVYDQETGKFLGAVALNQIHPFHQFANLGYWVRSRCAEYGIAVTATRMCARFGFEELGLKRIEIVAAMGNRRSQRVAEKAGAMREGILRSRLKIGDVWHDAVMFSLVPDDLKAMLV